MTIMGPEVSHSNLGQSRAWRLPSLLLCLFSFSISQAASLNHPLAIVPRSFNVTTALFWPPDLQIVSILFWTCKTAPSEPVWV